MKPSSLAAALAAFAALPASAATIVIDFDTLVTNTRVNQYYSGGVDSRGFAGTNLGVEFIDFIAALSGKATTAPNYAYLASALGKINVAAGFTSFDFAFGTVAPTTVNVYSGLNGSGTLLGTQVINGSFSAFAQGAVAFSGLAHSVTLAGTPNAAALDNLRFGLAMPVPEPATLAMMLAGFGVLGAFRRRRKPGA